jgi:hypothetical protein
MAQTPQSEETGEAGGTTAPGAGRPQGLFGSSTTILLLIFAVAVFWWSRRRRVEMEERLRVQRQEAEATAERSALDVAHLMRATPHPGAAAAAAREGLASAAPMPSPATPGPDPEALVDDRTTTEDDTLEHARTPLGDTEHEAYARAIERAEAGAEAERAAEEQAARAARDAAIAGESVVRRAAAAEAAAGEAEADTAEAEGSRPIGATPDIGADETRAVDNFGDGMPERGSDAAIPLGAIAGDGTANCPPDYPIKGNRQSRIYHRPGQGSYAPTVAEFCFASEEAAEAAGFRASRARGQREQP